MLDPSQPSKIYSGCPQGALDVPPGLVDAFCAGPCLAETELVLRCIDDIIDNFRFYNGASAADVRFALDRGCGHSGLRGDFAMLQRFGGDGYLYGHGARAWPLGSLAAMQLLLSAVINQSGQWMRFLSRATKGTGQRKGK